MVAVLVLVAAAGVLGLGSRDSGQQRPRLDVQAHRGGLGLRPESSAGAFAQALTLGVTTLELDVQITADGQPVVTHDRRVNPVVCRDTAPVAVGDRAFPYMGKLVKEALPEMECR